MTKPKPRKIKEPKPFDFYELDMIGTFLWWNSQDFIEHCQGFDGYTKKDVTKIMKKVTDHCFYSV
jgi:hypothetical protein